MPYQWPAKRNLIGTSVPRLDGALKVTGKAKYAFDRNLPGLLHAKILRSPHAHAKIVELDLTAAEAMPGVKASHVIKAAGGELRYAGDALRAVKVKYEVLPFEWSEEAGFKKGGAPKIDEAGNVDEALGKADAVIE